MCATVASWNMSGVQNPLFFRENTRMLFGDAKKTLDAVLAALRT
jgi:NAD(P) transhydrogenase subunit beta